MHRNKDGLLVVDKQEGMTSFDVVRRVRELADMSKVGHTGTLDPDATGVLPVALGRCTKLSQYLALDEKHYEFTAHFGAETDSDDASGEVIRRAQWEQVQRSDVEAVLPRFTGEIEQVPPVYSAIKVDGKRAYERARAGEDVEMEARTVEVRRLEITDWDLPAVRFSMHCGPGTYVRSLVRDIGRAVDSAAHAVGIRRMAVGPFTVEQALRLDEIDGGDFWSHVATPLQMVQSLPQYELDAVHQRMVGNGQPIQVTGRWERGEMVAGHDGEGNLVAVLECTKGGADGGQLWPRRVMI